MNAFLPRRFLLRPRLLGLTLASGLAAAVALPSRAQDAGGASDPFAAAPQGAASEALDSGKVSEEGDHDLQQAAREYQSVITSYDALRPRAAEALFRLGEIAAKLQQNDEARSLYSRVVAEFSGMGDSALRSQERLAGLGAGRGGSPLDTMDPVLAQRYGLQPVGGPQGMSPALAARYGLTVGGPAAAAGGGGVESGALVRVPAPTADSQAPGGSGLGGGAGMAPGAFATTAPATSPYTVNLTGGSTDKAATLRAEAAQIAAHLRKLRRERRALEAADFSQIPTALVEDTQALALIRSYDQARLAVLGFDAVRGGGEAKAGEDQAAQQREMLKSQELHAQSLLRSYLDQTCLPRLRITQELLAAELDELEVEISKARPKLF